MKNYPASYELRRLSINDGRDVYEMTQKIPANENGFQNGAFGLTFDEFKDYLVRHDNSAKGIGLEDWMVPQQVYWLFVDGKPVGYGKLRARLTERLRHEGGHAGYAIIADERGKGYATLLLKLLLDEARKTGIEKLLTTVNNDNPASVKVCVNNGGIIEKISGEKHYIWFNL